MPRACAGPIAGRGKLLRTPFTALANSPGLASASTSRQSLARWPRTPSATVQKTSARSWRTLALVGEPREAAGTGQHAQQRHLRERDGRRAIVDQPDLVAGERELVAAARARAIHRRDELEAGVRARVLHAVARLVRELAEVDLPRMRRQAEHEDVGARAEDAIARAGDDHRTDVGMLETDALERVVELDVDAQVVAN